MTSLLGWVIIVVALASIGLAALYPVYRLARRPYPESVRVRWIYAVAAIGCGLAIWLLLPVVVHRLFGRSAG
jgi:uncharacterized membrane-anchored protein